jgi:peptide/nickel transport system ATP-binding protein
MALLEIKGLKTHFATDDGIVQAVDGVDLTINRGETLCVVGCPAAARPSPRCRS